MAGGKLAEVADGGPRYGVMSVCGRRRDMEDAVSVRPDLLKDKHHFFGVFDGHGCSHVAAACRDRMHEIVAAEAKADSSGSSGCSPEWKGVMERSFARMDAEAAVVTPKGPEGEEENPNCHCELQTPKCDHVGSTAVVAVVSPNVDGVLLRPAGGHHQLAVAVHLRVLWLLFGPSKP